MTDKYGRRVVIIYVNIMVVIIGYISAYSNSAVIYIIFKLVIGICIGMSVILCVYLDEVALKGWRSRNMVLYGLFF